MIPDQRSSLFCGINKHFDIELLQIVSPNWCTQMFFEWLKLNDTDFYINIIIDAALAHQMQETKPSRLSVQPLSLKADLYHLLEQVPRRSDL